MMFQLSGFYFKPLPQGSKGSNNKVLDSSYISYLGLYLGEYMIIKYLDP